MARLSGLGSGGTDGGAFNVLEGTVGSQVPVTRVLGKVPVTGQKR
jgi:hypothetical protein